MSDAAVEAERLLCGTWIAEWYWILRGELCPEKTFLEDEFHHGAILFSELGIISQVPSQVGGDTLEEINSISLWRWLADIRLRFLYKAY